MEELVVVVAALSAVISSTLGGLLTKRQKSDLTDAAEEALEERLARLAETMKTSATLMNQIELELGARAETAKKLKKEADEARAISELTREQQEAVAKIVQAGAAKEGKRSGRIQLIANFLFFVAGAAISILITIYVRPAAG